MLIETRTPTYNTNFNTETGLHMRWGKQFSDDPQYSPIGPEILDIEVSTICRQGCRFCYKGNTGRGTNMYFDTFTHILDKMPTVQQIAFGIGDIDTNPHLFSMMSYCRTHGVVPNITINGSKMRGSDFDFLAATCGAVAISYYDRTNTMYCVKELSKRGMKQINIHALVSTETYTSLLTILDDMKNNRYEGLNAVVFLSLKQKGRGVGYTPLSDVLFSDLMKQAKGLRVGFDSCSAHKFESSLTETEKKVLGQFIEPCESACFSSYINVDGDFFPCSFAEGTVGWEQGVSVVDSLDFLQDVWYNPRTIEWRNKLIKAKRHCPIYNI